VIKDYNDFIIELLTDIDSGGSDSDSDPDYDGGNDRGATGDFDEDPEAVPEGAAP
jgi:hypothetical protein